jgi:hypothetical protein
VGITGYAVGVTGYAVSVTGYTVILDGDSSETHVAAQTHRGNGKTTLGTKAWA